MEKLFFFGIYVIACYLIANWGRQKKIGFNEALALSVLNPLIGIAFVYFSADKNAPEKQPEKPKTKLELTNVGQESFSILLKKYHTKQITKAEFEAAVAKYK